MSAQTVPPLRIQKGTPGSSPNKMTPVSNRPLAEVGPMAIRRNSPSFPQGNKSNMFKAESSPFSGSSPYNANTANSPRLFWHEREPISPARGSLENRSPFTNQSPVPAKRSSIENLKKASRVKNSSMFALEQNNQYDPAQPAILNGRPLNTSVQGNAFGGRGLDGLRKDVVSSPSTEEGKKVIEGAAAPCLPPPNTVAPLSPSKANVSPTKSSLSKRTGHNARRAGFDPETGIWSDDDDTEKKLPEGRGLHRRGKSVTFDQAPPQVNEYEMTTPDPSSVASGSREGSYESMDDEDVSFERGSSLDREDSFDASLEDTDKTPVVLPEDWRFMSPENANTELSQHEEDIFEDDLGSPAPTAQPGMNVYRPQQSSVNSVDSNGQPRPLPPIPSLAPPQMPSSESRDSLSGTLERISSSQRSIPSLPQAAIISKSDIRRMSGGTFSLEDRLRLMMVQDNDQSRSHVEKQRERRMRRAGSKDSSPVRGATQHAAEASSDSDCPGPAIVEDNTAPRISRDGILRRLRSEQDLNDYATGSEPSNYGSSPPVHMPLDPDVPIPSLEDPTQNLVRDHETERVLIKEEEIDGPELYSIPDLYTQQAYADFETDIDMGCQYAKPSTVPQINMGRDEGTDTPRALSPAREPEKKALPSERMSLPDFMDFGGQSSFDIDLSIYMTPPADQKDSEKNLPRLPVGAANTSESSIVRSSTQRPITPEFQLPDRSKFGGDFQDESGTPESVIRHTMEASPQSDIPEADVMSESAEEIAPITMPERHQDGPSPCFAETQESNTIAPSSQDEPPAEVLNSDAQKKRKSSLVQLDIPRDQNDEGLGFGLEKEFDRVVEAQKRGYLMRQNTKVVVASERIASGEIKPETAADTGLATETNSDKTLAAPAYRKISQPTWTAEPWNGKSRRRSIRTAGEKSPTKRRAADGPAPPLPGQASNVQDGLGAVAEDEIAEEEAEDFEDGAERGRLFVKVVGVKDLDLPLPHHERTSFALTLDNGLHCVTTAWLDLNRSAPIGQEFELVVLNELEFQLTLQMKLEEPKIERPSSPTKAPSSPAKKQGTFGRLFGSPKKRKESELRAQQEAQVIASRPVTPPSAYELVQGLVAKDGSFARAYVALSEHEKQAFGRPYAVDVVCFNEWAMEEVNVGSSRSKKSVTQLQRRPPYPIGKLELQLLYIPKPKNATDEDMPKSMNSALRELKEAETRMSQAPKEFEGHLSQQGGDCPYWRRRLFKLVGSKLTAYHEATLQPRATINLAKASKLIDDKSALTQKETSTKGGGRRKSAFAEEEEGYMFVEEGFRIRFANGEVIDFYAESAENKDEWMKVLSQVVGKGAIGSTVPVKGWAEIVLKREKSMRRQKGVSSPQKCDKELPRPEQMQAAIKAAAVKDKNRLSQGLGVQHPNLPPSSIPTPNGRSPARPQGHGRTESHPPQAYSRSQANSPVKSRVSREERQKKTRSMIDMQWR